MKKKIMLILIVTFILVMPTYFPKAIVRASDIISRNECPNFEVALARSDGLDKIQCYDTYDQAKAAMDADPRDDVIIIEHGVVINAKYAVIDYDSDRRNIIYVYNSSTSNTHNGHYILSTSPDDAVVLDYDYNTKRIKIKVSGLTGWIDKKRGAADIYDVVPLVWMTRPQYYQVTSDKLIHHFPGNIYGTNEPETSSITIDAKPTMLSEGNYYSYDGHYFYTNLKTLINDYKNNTYQNSVNPANPYYNFYQYLSFRTKTVYSADNINDYLNSRTSESSVLRNTGALFTKYQDLYGTNAILMLSISSNESAMGTSLIARNNIFGLNAVDANPSGNADGFDSIEDCIRQFSYYWLSFGFLQPGDNGGGISATRFRGSNVGNKDEGLNYKYASDPFWGEKAASYYYQLDKRYGFQEKKQAKYAIAVLNNTYPNGVYAKKTPNGENVSSFYKYVNIDSPVVVVAEVKDSNGKTWYKIQSDATLDANGNFINNSTDNGGNNQYLWDKSYVYVDSSYFTKITDITVNTETYNENNNNNNNNNQDPQQPEEPKIPVSTVVSSASYGYGSGMITGINLNTEASALIASLTAKGAQGVTITTEGGTPKSGRLATGDKVIIQTNAGTETLVIIIFGDTTGDGIINASDYVRIKNHIMETSRLSGAYEKAADYNGDNTITASDYVKVKNYIMGQ